MAWKETSFEEFTDGCHGGHLGYQNQMSNSESLCHSDAFHQVSAQSDLWFRRRCRLKNSKCLPSSFSSIQLTVWEEMFEEFQDGHHLGYQNGTILAILNNCVTVMPPIKFQLNRTYGLEDLV